MNLFSSFHNDPFFSDIDLPQALALENRSRRYDNHDRQITTPRNHHVDVFHTNPFGFMQNTMNNMQQMMNYMETRTSSNQFNRQNNHGVSFSSSTVMSMDSRNGGQPRIFQATSEQIRGPEGLERTRKAVRDTGRNVEKMEIAHRLGERGHRIIKERDPSSGQILENREFEHIEDENQFEREWSNRAEHLGLKNLHGNGFNSRTNHLLVTPPSSFGRLRSQSQDPRHLPIEHGHSNNTTHSRRKK